MVEIAEQPRRPRGRPQIRPDSETHRLVIEAARQEFQANGYAATSMGAVARRAGVSTRTVYRLIPTKATPAELRGEALFNGKARCNTCHPPPFYTDNRMHDLRVEEFYPGRAEGWVKTFALRGIKDSPPYFHDGRLPTLEDSVEFFNLLLGLKLTRDEKNDLVAFLLAL